MKQIRRRVAAAVEAFRCDPTDELRINGVHAARFAKRAYGLGDDLDGPGRFDMSDPVQAKLRRVRDWIKMAEHDALNARRAVAAEAAREHDPRMYEQARRAAELGEKRGTPRD